MELNNIEYLGVRNARHIGHLNFSLVLLLLMTGMVKETGAQDIQKDDKSTPKAVYLTVGLGMGTSGWLAGQIGLTTETSIGEFTLRHAGLEEFNFLGPSEKVNDISLLYGLRRVNGMFWYSLTGGLGHAWIASEECVSWNNSSGGGMGFSFGGRCSRYEIASRQWGTGLAFQSTFGWGFISVSALGNVNHLKSFTAVTFNLHLGKMR